MADRQPTIEQNSHFTAKTKQGQDVEFVATLRFYVSPTGQVSISAPGGSTATSVRESTSSTNTQIGVSGGSERSSSTGLTKQGDSSSSVGAQAEHSQSNTEKRVEKEITGDGSERGRGSGGIESKGSGGIKRDESIDRAFPRGPPSDCPITQFIPDPCRAIDDIQKSIKSLFSSYFSGRNCPPPQNTDNPRTPDGLYIKPVGEEDPDSLKEDKARSEVVENEEKYEM